MENRTTMAIDMANRVINDVKLGVRGKINAVWIETSGCFGEVISLLNAYEPDVIYMLEEFVNMEYFGSLMGNQGEVAYERLLGLLNTEFVLIVSGAIPTKSNGLYATLATYKGKGMTAMEVVDMIAKKAKYIMAVGACAAFGGPTSAKPNESEGKSVSEFLGRDDIINIPGCPANPVCTMGILGYLTSVGVPKLDSNRRPIDYYGQTIHDTCPRRRYFEAGIFADTFGDKECMFMLGCKGPITYEYCAISRWNGTDNWPVGNNTTCIGCAAPGFPDLMGPFVKYGGGGL